MTAAPLRDDPTIPDDALLWRRVPPWHFYHDENLGRSRPAGAAFDDDPDGSPMSVTIAGPAARPDAELAGHEGFALAAITAGLVRSCGLGVARDPLPTNPAHGLVFGRKTRSVLRRLAREARWVVQPPD